MTFLDFVANLTISIVGVAITAIIAKHNSKVPKFLFLEMLSINLYAPIFQQTSGIEIFYGGEKIKEKLFSIEGIIYFDSKQDIGTATDRSNIYIRLTNEKATWKNFRILSSSKDLQIQHDQYSDQEYKISSSGYKIDDYIKFSGIATDSEIEIRTDILNIKRKAERLKWNTISLLKNINKYLATFLVMFMIGAFVLKPISFPNLDRKLNLQTNKGQFSVKLDRSNFDSIVRISNNNLPVNLNEFDSLTLRQLEKKSDSLVLLEDSLWLAAGNDTIDYKFRFLSALRLVKVQGNIHENDNILSLWRAFGGLKVIQLIYDSLNEKHKIYSEQNHYLNDSSIIFRFDSSILSNLSQRSIKVEPIKSNIDWVSLILSIIFFIIALVITYFMVGFKKYINVGEKIKKIASDNS